MRMKPFRLLLWGSLVLTGLVLVAGLLLFNASFQTWAARKALAGQPGLEVSLHRVSAGLQRVQVEQVRATFSGATLVLPALEVRLPLLDAALRERVAVSRLVAKGWTLDLTGHTSARPPEAVDAAAAAAGTASVVFQGIFNQLQLPVDLSLDGIELEGEVLFPEEGGGTGRARVQLQGGRLGAQQEGAFTFAATAGLASGDQPVDALGVRGTLQATMDSPRSFARIALRVDAEASGRALPQGVQLTADVVAARVSGGENYGLNVQSVGKRLVDLQANFPENSSRLGGVWKLDLRDTDVAPFMLGRPLPSFEVVGAGMFATDADFSEVHAAGRLKTSADRLASILPELAAVGAFDTYGEFDVTWRGPTVRIDHLSWNLTQAGPVLTVQALQSFEYNNDTGELKVAEAAADLLVMNLQGIPLRWAAPFVPDYSLNGGAVRGELVMGAGGGGLAVRSRHPFAVQALSVARSGEPLVREVDLSARLAAEYSPEGWQVELPGLSVTSGGVELLSLAVRAGRLARADEPIKATGRLAASLPALLRQPAAPAGVTLAGGKLKGEFTADLGATMKYGLAFRLDELAVPTGEPLPVIQGNLRADIDEAGAIEFELPLVFSNPAAARESDLAVSGTLAPDGTGLKVAATLRSQVVHVEDVQVLAVLAGPVDETAATKEGVHDKPFWAGVSGQLVLALKKVHYSDFLEASEVGGTVRLEAGALRLDDLRAGMGEGSDARMSGLLSFEPAVAKPYALNADLTVNDFNPAGILKSLQPDQPATVDGKFTITSKLIGRGENLPALAEAAQGDFNLTSRGGIFRGLPVSVAGKVESTGRIAAGVSAVGNLLGSVTGRREYADIGNKAQAVAELAQSLSAIPYDQLSLVLARDELLITALKDFTLISPEIRLSGVGEARPGLAGSWLESALAMDFQLRARGHTGDLLNYLGVLEAAPDELGYARSTLPLKISGTLASPDTGELNRALANLALEKSGAADLLNRLLGGGK